MEGTCSGIIALHNYNILNDYFKIGWSDSNIDPIDIQYKNSYLVLAVGTGLGNQFLNLLI